MGVRIMTKEAPLIITRCDWCNHLEWEFITEGGDELCEECYLSYLSVIDNEDKEECEDWVRKHEEID